MDHIWLPRWIGTATLVASLVACGGSDPDEASDTPASEEPGVAPGNVAPGNVAPGNVVAELPEGNGPARLGDDSSDPAASQVELSIEGRANHMGAQALLRVREGDPEVHLSITGAEGRTDLFVIDLQFEGLENTLGEHSVEFGLPYAGDFMANANLSGEAYHSQSGPIAFTLTADGRIGGTFDVAMALDGDDVQNVIGETSSGSPIALPVFEPSTDLTPLTGSFAGTWVLSCESHLPGHGAWQYGGNYCDNLEL